MTDSYIELDEKGNISAYVGPDATRYFQAKVLCMGLRARKSGIQLARNYTPKRLFKTATSFTNKPYKITEYDEAIKDLETWLRTMEAALPMVTRTPITP
jgi:hypothetical protein